MNNKTIIEFDFRIIWRIMEISEGVICRGRRPRRITPSSISIILHKILSLIHQLLIIIPSPFTNIANTISDRSYSRSLTGVISGIKRYMKLRIFRISVSVFGRWDSRMPCSRYLGYVRTIPDCFYAVTKTILDRASVHTYRNGDFGGI